MALAIDREVATLRQMSVGQLQAKYAEVFGEQPRGRHRLWLLRRIAWRLQALAEGDLSERARHRARELAHEADLRLTAPKDRGGSSHREPVGDPSSQPDARLPMPGTLLSRTYKGRTILVKILENGFEFEGGVFSSLSAVAKSVTGSHWNGFHFFGLTRREVRT
jgi:hypothetical protein